MFKKLSLPLKSIQIQIHFLIYKLILFYNFHVFSRVFSEPLMEGSNPAGPPFLIQQGTPYNFLYLIKLCVDEKLDWFLLQNEPHNPNIFKEKS